MVRQEIAVTKSTGFRVTELEVKERGRKTVLKLFYDGDGYISKVQTIGSKIDFATLAGVLNQNYLNLANIQTADGTNILVDKLTQGAYSERRSTFSNDNGTSPTLWVFDYRKGKFFQRGMRGFITTVELYLEGGANDRTVTISFYRAPNEGLIFAETYTLTAGTAAAWRSVTINRMWNYDSMFIVAECSSVADGKIGQDTVENPDGYHATVGTNEFTPNPTERFWIRVTIHGTVGDVPVSGTINNIEIPNMSSARQAVALNWTGAGYQYDTMQYGTGKLKCAIFRVGSANDYSDLTPIVEADGVSVLPHNDNLEHWYNFITQNSDPPMGWGVHDVVTPQYTLIISLEIPFKKSLRIGMYNEVGAARSAVIEYIYEKIS
jgi:hypothetical protein